MSIRCTWLSAAAATARAAAKITTSIHLDSRRIGPECGITHLVEAVGVAGPELATLRRFCAGWLSLGFGGCEFLCESCGGRKDAVAVNWTLRASVRSSAGVLAPALRDAGSADAMSDSGSANADEGSVRATA